MRRRWLIGVVTVAVLGAVGMLRAEEPVVGGDAPAFAVKDMNGKEHKLSDYTGKYVVLEWTNHGCPFVRKQYNSGNMQKLQKTYTGKGVIWLTVCSSAPGKQGNMSPEQWQKLSDEKKVASTATLLDTDGAMGRAYGAKSTPHMFVISPEGKLIYMGAIDDDRSANPANVAAAKNYVTAALEAAMAGKPVETSSTKSYGCSVKY